MYVKFWGYWRRTMGHQRSRLGSPKTWSLEVKMLLYNYASSATPGESQINSASSIWLAFLELKKLNRLWKICDFWRAKHHFDKSFKGSTSLPLLTFWNANLGLEWLMIMVTFKLEGDAHNRLGELLRAHRLSLYPIYAHTCPLAMESAKGNSPKFRRQ